MKLILPFPPSVNTYWRHPNKGAFAGKSLISAAGRKFQSAACTAIVEQLRRLPKPTSAPASVEIVLFPPDIKLIYTLRKAHRTGAKFMMNNNSLFAIRLLKDSEGNYLWRPGLELGQPSSLAGYGIAENEQMPDIAADAKAIAFGNFKRGYTIVDRIGTRILRDPYTNKPFVGFYTTKRTGGMLVDSQAIKLLKIAAA
ncbi:phage major capsid protein [Escherichia coli]|nr:phage major capsid protein [Escherichia coli]EFD1724996.1 phage major capsid protein [Escherichia coli]